MSNTNAGNEKNEKSKGRKKSSVLVSQGTDKPDAKPGAKSNPNRKPATNHGTASEPAAATSVPQSKQADKSHQSASDGPKKLLAFMDKLGYSATRFRSGGRSRRLVNLGNPEDHGYKWLKQSKAEFRDHKQLKHQEKSSSSSSQSNRESEIKVDFSLEIPTPGFSLGVGVGGTSASARGQQSSANSDSNSSLLQLGLVQVPLQVSKQDLDPEFAQALAELKSSHSDSEVESFLWSWGTDYVCAVVLGGLDSSRGTNETQESTASSSKSSSAKVSGTPVATLQASATSSSIENDKQSAHALSSVRAGGNPASSADEWLETALQDPCVIQWKTLSITYLLDVEMERIIAPVRSRLVENSPVVADEETKYESTIVLQRGFDKYKEKIDQEILPECGKFICSSSAQERKLWENAVAGILPRTTVRISKPFDFDFLGDLVLEPDPWFSANKRAESDAWVVHHAAKKDKKGKSEKSKKAKKGPPKDGDEEEDKSTIEPEDQEEDRNGQDKQKSSVDASSQKAVKEIHFKRVGQSVLVIATFVAGRYGGMMTVIQPPDTKGFKPNARFTLTKTG